MEKVREMERRGEREREGQRQREREYAKNLLSESVKGKVETALAMHEELKY